MKRIFNNKPFTKIDLKQTIKKAINTKELTGASCFAFHSQNNHSKALINNKISVNSLIKRNLLFSGIISKNFASLPRHKTLTLPSLSPSMEKGSISEWKKKEGDKVNVGESIAGIETDKAVVDFELNDECYIAKILKPTGTKDIELGAVSKKLSLYLLMIYYIYFNSPFALLLIMLKMLLHLKIINLELKILLLNLLLKLKHLKTKPQKLNPLLLLVKNFPDIKNQLFLVYHLLWKRELLQNGRKKKEKR